MDMGSMVRTIFLAAALINQILVMNGHPPLPYSNAEMESTLTWVLTSVASVWAWWKNNYISHKGRKQKVVLQREGLTK
ncbi:phage holin [Heyndrickxia acidicola]|uniref:Phage holin n=1 Tax=Heyndrickxia acidicola TaxID=209389 RepID=A0ABU6MCC3_9BACI|nr:phage holin [Heyndrickxia acidicola]MED1202315.1 phage holin [Heyndrickxia acidicola]